MRKKWIGLFLMIAVYCNASAQELYDSLLNVLHTKYPQERIYIQLDKSYYNTGETVWFKAYITAGNATPLVSTTLYAELINGSGVVLQKKTMPVLQGGAASHFELDGSDSSSKFFIRAYTTWMLNFDSSFLYLKPLTVIRKKKDEKKNPALASFTLTFFPEGGDLVQNIPGRVAFKTNNQDGAPFPVSGIITDSKNNNISTFKSIHNGMGYFALTPLPGELYKAIWKDKAGVQHSTQLPEAKEQGISLNIINSNGQCRFTLSRPAETSDAFKKLTVVAQMNQQLVYAAKINLGKVTIANAMIPTDSLPDGIMQVTVFNALQVPVAERIVFVNNNNYSFITDVHLVDKNISRHGKNVLQVDVGGNAGSNLSVSVTDAGIDYKEAGPENILSQLMLSGDLKGAVYQPAYYFSSDEDSVKNHLDLVMMTNGWRRFTWQKILGNEWPELTYLPDKYLSVTGNVFGLTKSQLSSKMLTGILQSSEKNSSTFISIPVKEDGSFKVNDIYFFDTVKLYYQFNDDKNKTLTNKASFSFNTGSKKIPPLAFGSLSSLYFNPVPDSGILLKSIRQHDLYLSQLKLQKIKTLETVTVTGKIISLKDKMDKELTSGLFSSGNARIFTTEDDPFAKSALTVLDYLRGKVAGLVINVNGMNGGSISRRGSNTDLFLNEMNAQIDMLQSIPMTEVAMIKVFDPPFFGASGGGAGGAVAVYTKKGGSANPMVTGLNMATLYGFSAIKEFYVPDYSTISNDIPDYRTTLYWQPFLLMDAKNKRVTIPFVNNDTGKKIRVIIEGINEKGQVTREEKIFE